MKSGARILVVDDEKQIRRSLRRNFRKNGYAIAVAESGEEALDRLVGWKPDVLIVDLLLPGMDGIEFTRRVRKDSRIPIVLLSAVVEERQKIRALEVGADDYVTKPFSMGELTARIRSLLRRCAGVEGPDAVFRTGDLAVDFDRREVRLRNETVRLTPTEYELLKQLIHNAGRVMTHKMLLDAVWGPGREKHAQYLRVFVGQLRKKLEEVPARPRYILTDSGVGYRFNVTGGENGDRYEGLGQE